MSALTKTVKLARPVKRDGGDVAEVTLVEPNAGSMRGLKQGDILEMNVTAMLSLLPRITRPALQPSELEVMGPRDFLELSKATVLFFVTSGELEELESAASGSPTT